MRPTFFALCAAGLLLASGSPCAVAQEEGSPAPLISSGHPSSLSPGSSSGARRTLSDDEPSSPPGEEPARLHDAPTALRDAPTALRSAPTAQREAPLTQRDAPALGDQAWTTAPVQPANSATQSSRAVNQFSDTGATRPDASAQQPTRDSAAPLHGLPGQPSPLRPVPSHSGRAAPAGTASASAGAAPATMATGTPQAAGGVYPASGSSRLRSHIAQAQFTSTAPSSPEPARETHLAKAAGDEHRPLKPPTASDPASDQKRSSGTVQMFISVISSLLIVVGLLLGAAWCYRKATPNLAGSLPKQALQVLGRTQLAPRQQLILVRFGPKLVLMSNLQGEVRAISEIVDPLEVDRLCGMCESSQAGSISDSFRTVLHNIGRTG